MEASQEVLFAKTLEQVRKQAKEQGNCIEREQVEQAFASLSLSKEQLDFANELESQIDAERKALKKIARKRLEDGADVKAELLYMDLVRQIEKIGDRCFNIAEQLALTK